jgi:8-hydroxy-5-deazaflavin:NADPH oxidoreductase
MKIAIIGTGNVGTRLEKLFTLANHQVIMGSRNHQRALEVAAAIGVDVQGKTYKHAAHDAEVVIIAIPWSEDAAKKAVQELGNLAEKIVIDCTNPLAPDYMSNTLGHTTSSSEEIAKLIPQARVVKAFNTIFADVMQPGKQTFNGHKSTGFYCGDDPEAKKIVAKLINDAGFEPIDAGKLKNARYLEPMAQLNIQIAYGLGGGTDVAFRYMRRQIGDSKSL